MSFLNLFFNQNIAEISRSALRESFVTGVYFTAKTMLQKFEVFTGDYLAAYQFAYKFLTKIPTKVRTNAEKSWAIYLNPKLSTWRVHYLETCILRKIPEFEKNLKAKFLLSQQPIFLIGKGVWEWWQNPQSDLANHPVCQNFTFRSIQMFD